MKILFMYTLGQSLSVNEPRVDMQTIQFGISYISAFLKQHGHQTRLLLLTRGSDMSSMDKYIDTFLPGMICFTAVASEYIFVERIGRYVQKKFPEIYRVLGGVHVSLTRDETMLDVFDALCIGEGEFPVLELTEQLEKGIRPSVIPNLWFKTEAGIEKNPPRPFNDRIDLLPFPDRQMWEEWIDPARSSRRPTIILGRGCPYSCSYCCNHAIKKIAPGKYVRMRDVDNIIAEIKSITGQYPFVREFYFEVETFGADINWSFRLCSSLEKLNKERPLPLTFGVNLRVFPGLIPKLDSLFSAMKDAGFRYVNIGLESGSGTLRKSILKRRYSNEDIRMTVSVARNHGMLVVFYNLLGLPHETLHDLNKTIDINKECLPEWHYLSIFHPYPGTELYHLCQREGLLPENLLSAELERVKVAMDYPDLSKRKIQKAFIWFDYYVYQGHRPIEKLVNDIVMKYSVIYKGSRVCSLMMLMIIDCFYPGLRIRKKAVERKVVLPVIKALFRQSRFRLFKRVG